MTKLEDVVRAISGMCPELLVKEESDGNVVISLNMYLDNSGHNLIGFYETQDEEEED